MRKSNCNAKRSALNFEEEVAAAQRNPFNVPKGTPHKEKNSDEKTVLKRRNGIIYIKSTTEFARYQELLQEDKITRLAEPDPEDLSVPKRTWERQMQDWRIQLRALSCRPSSNVTDADFKQ